MPQSAELVTTIAASFVGVIFFGEHELASAMTRHVLARRGLKVPEPILEKGAA